MSVNSHQAPRGAGTAASQAAQGNIRQQLRQIEALYQDYLRQLNELKAMQDKVFKDFIKQIEQKKLAAVRQKLARLSGD